MATLSHFLRDLRQLVFRNAEQHAIPSMDGALSPNDRLDACRPIGEALPGADDVVAAGDEVLYVSAGRQVWRLEGAGFARRSVVATFAGEAGGLALHPDGRLLVCVAGHGLAAIDAQGREAWLSQAEDRPLRCPTGVAAAPDGAIFMTEGSLRHEPAAWAYDLLEKGRDGRLVACGPGLDAPRVLLRDLEYPHGIALSADQRQIWFTESWAHRVHRAQRQGREIAPPDVVIGNLPGYPARLGRASAGGFWLSLFAPRTHLVEFVLREDDYREEMMRTIPPEFWIAPALSTDHHPLEPMQFGSLRALGIRKPWAPPRSYGLLMRIDGDGEAMESLHSRVGGHHHGITAACDTAQGVAIVAKGSGRVLLFERGASA